MNSPKAPECLIFSTIFVQLKLVSIYLIMLRSTKYKTRCKSWDEFEVIQSMFKLETINKEIQSTVSTYLFYMNYKNCIRLVIPQKSFLSPFITIKRLVSLWRICYLKHIWLIWSSSWVTKEEEQAINNSFRLLEGTGYGWSFPETLNGITLTKAMLS